MQAVVFEDAQGVVIGVEKLLESLGSPTKVGTDCMDDISGVGHVEGRGDDCGTILQRRLILGTGGTQSGYAGLFEDHTTDTTSCPKTGISGVDDRIDSLIGTGCVDQYDFAHRNSFLLCSWLTVQEEAFYKRSMKSSASV